MTVATDTNVVKNTNNIIYVLGSLLYAHADWYEWDTWTTTDLVSRS